MQRRLRLDGLALVVVVLAVRGGVLAARFDGLGRDPDAYRRLAAGVTTHGVLGYGEQPSAFRPPLYPLLVAACRSIGSDDRWAIAALHLAAGVATVVLTYNLGRRWGLAGWAWPAALAVACDPILLVQSTLVMTETLAALLAVVALAAITRMAATGSRRAAAVAGASVGLAALCRPTFLPWAAAVAAWLVIDKRWNAATVDGRPSHGIAVTGYVFPAWCGRLAAALAFAAGAAVVLAPWAVRNQLQFGKPILTTTHGGYTLLLGNNPGFYEYLRSGRWGEVWWSDKLDADFARRVAESAPGDELRRDRLAYEEAKRNIRRQPAMFLYASLVRVGRLWSVLPHQISATESTASRLARYAVAVWYTIVLALAVVGIVSVFSRPTAGRLSVDASVAVRGWIAAALLVLSFTAVHAVYWTDMRMRAPLMPVVVLAAAAGWRRLAQRA